MHEATNMQRSQEASKHNIASNKTKKVCWIFVGTWLVVVGRCVVSESKNATSHYKNIARGEQGDT
jgi:hypothetical protein